MKEKLVMNFTHQIIKRINELKKLYKNELVTNNKERYNPILRRRKLNISEIVFNIINRCNLKCRYCWSRGGTYDRSRVGEKMNKEIVYKGIELMIKNSRNIPTYDIVFYGGEPLLNFELIKDTIEYCKSLKRAINKNFSFRMDTNGTLLTKDIAEYLLSNGVKIAISIDGPPEIHDKLRIFPNGRGSFSKIIQNFTSFSDEIKKNIVARITFTPLHTNLKKTIRYLYKMGFRNFQVADVQEECFNFKKEDSQQIFFIEKDDIKTLKKIYSELYLFYLKELIERKVLFSKKFVREIADIYHPIRRTHFICGGGREMIAVSTNGDIYPCIGFLELGYKMGNVFTGITTEEVEVFSTKSIILNNDKCKSCWAKYLCGGRASCYAINYFHNKDILIPYDKKCDIFKYLVELRFACLSVLIDKKPSLLNLFRNEFLR